MVNEAVKAYCVKTDSTGNGNIVPPKHFVENLKIVAVIYLAQDLKSVSVRMPVRSMRNLFRQSNNPGKKFQGIEMEMGDFKFPYPHVPPTDPLVTVFVNELARRIQFNLPQ